MGPISLPANPTGPSTNVGSATYNGLGTATVTIDQKSNFLSTNWQSFSNNPGELIQFIQPSSSSIALNRVIGGGTSYLLGNLQANGQVFLINQNGIVIGSHALINAAGFTASTRDITDFNAGTGNLQFLGSSTGGVQNLGTINALNGDVVLIGKTVDNQGTINAPNGTVGLVSGDNVLLAQQNSDGSTITVSASSTATAALDQTAVSNNGVINAASAELKAANGNLYALAINNTGTIRATTVSNQGGHIWLTSDGGTLQNSGTLNASATAVGGTGGTVALLNKKGTAIHSGKIIAQGGKGGVGGNAEISGGNLGFTGTVDLTAPGGKTGLLVLDPTTLEVISGGAGTLSGGQNDSAPGIDPNTVDLALGTANVTLNADTNITILDGITWTSANTFTLSTNTSGSTINLNAPISGVNGGLTINMAGGTDVITPSALGSIDVANFILTSGAWTQNANGGTLAGFTASHDFEIPLAGGRGTFLRAQGGNGTVSAPYQLTDIYGVQGISGFLSSNFVLNNDIDASGTETWNGGAGFVPIGLTTTNSSSGFIGTFNGQGNTIDGLFINLPSYNQVGLFAANDGTIENVGVTNENVTGSGLVGGLVGWNVSGTVANDYTTGTVTSAGGQTGGLIGQNAGVITNTYSTATVNGGGGSSIGGLAGSNSGTISTSYATGTVSGGSSVGALVGVNTATVSSSYYLTPSNAIAGIGAGTTTGATSESLANLQTLDSLAGNGFDFTSTWTTNGGTTTPQLQIFNNITLSGVEYSDLGQTPLTSGDTLDLVSNLKNINPSGYKVSANGDFTISVPKIDLSTGNFWLVDATNAPTSPTSLIYISNKPITSSIITGIDLYGNTARVVGPGTATSKIISNIGVGNGVLSLGIFADNSANNFSLNVQRGNLQIETDYDLDADVTVSAGSLTTVGTGGLIANTAGKVTVAASGNIILNGSDSSVASGSELNFNAPTVDLNADIANNGTLTGTATTVNVGTGGLVQNGVDIAASGATLNLNNNDGTANASPTTYALGGKEILIQKSLTVNGNKSTLDAGGTSRVMEIDGSTSGVAVTLNDLVFTNGNAGTSGNANGGGLWINGAGSGNSATVTINESTFSNNTAASGIGGAIDNDAGIAQAGTAGQAQLTLNNVTLYKNRAAFVGAIFNSGVATINNTTIANNTSTTGGGGAISTSNTAGQGTLNLNYDTIVGNTQGSTSAQGAGIINTGGIISIRDTILEGNTYTDANGAIQEDDYFSSGGTITSLGHNLYTTSGFSGSGTKTPSSSDINTALPLNKIVQTDSSGTPILSFTGLLGVVNLVTGSPAVDGGAAYDGGPTTDELGTLRGSSTAFTGTAPDIGAFEATQIVLSGGTGAPALVQPQSDTYGSYTATQYNTGGQSDLGVITVSAPSGAGFTGGPVLIDGAPNSNGYYNVGTYLSAIGTLAPTRSQDVIVFNEGLIKITAKPVTLSLTGSATKTYDGTSTVTDSSLLTYNIAGIVSGDSATVTPTATDFTSGGTPTANANSNLDVTATGLTLSNNNYTLGTTTSVTGTGLGSITPANASVVVGNASSTYGSNPDLSTVSLTVTGLIPSESSSVLGLTPTVDTTTYNHNTNAGTYTGVISTSSSDKNYKLTITNGNLTINPAQLLFTANLTQILTLAGFSTPFTGKVTGFQNNDTPTSIFTNGPNWTSVANSTSPNGQYAINGDATLNNHNYTIIQASSNATALTLNIPDTAPITPAVINSLTQVEADVFTGSFIFNFPDGPVTLFFTLDTSTDTLTLNTTASGDDDSGSGKGKLGGGSSIGGGSAPGKVMLVTGGQIAALFAGSASATLPPLPVQQKFTLVLSPQVEALLQNAAFNLP